MDDWFIIHFSYLCGKIYVKTETMSKKVSKIFGSPRIFPYICPRIAT